MEDIDNCVFIKRDQQIFYKQILNTYILNELKKELHSEQNNFKNNDTNLATRKKLIDNCINSNILDEIKETIQTVLKNYFQKLEINDIRFYKQTYGETKKHIDKSLDGKSNYTLLVYLSDDFEGGELILKCKRTDEEMEASEKDKKHLQFTIKPKQGYGIIFDKNIPHWSPEVYGCKELMLVDLYAVF
jgi:hypothetical protein